MAFVMVLCLFMATLTILRFAFMIMNWETFSSASVLELFLSFLNGTRFDLRFILIITGVFFLALHIPGSMMSIPQSVRKILWLPFILFLPAIALCLLNMHYYTEAGRHLSHEIFSVTSDANDLKASLKMVAQYRWSIMAFFGLSVLLTLGWGAILGRMWKADRKSGVRLEIAWLVIFVLFLFLGVRGTVTGRPLRMSNAFIQGSTELGHLSLNPLFTVEKDLTERGTAIPTFFRETEAVATVRELLGSSGTSWLGDNTPLLRKTVNSLPGPEVKYNVVFILLESWSPAFLGVYGNPEGLTPEFDNLAAGGLLFTNFYSVGKRTDEGLAAVCLGIPSFNNSRISGKGSFLSGALEQNRYRGIGGILADNGYSSVFIHGESSDTFRQASLARLAGFNKHFGSGELKLTRQETSGPWGGWDHVMLDRLFQTILGEREPFAVFWISLSNHEPYSLPDRTFQTARPGDPNGKFKDSIRYTDHHLGKFFDRIRGEDLFNRTIFVITADHSARIITSMEERYHIPLLIYAPGVVKPGLSTLVGSQLDLIPTLLDLLGLSSPHHAMGSSLFDKESKRFAFLKFSPGYGWIRGQDLLEISPDGTVIGSHRIGTGETTGGDTDLRRRELLSFLQVGQMLLIEDRFAPVP